MSYELTYCSGSRAYDLGDLEKPGSFLSIGRDPLNDVVLVDNKVSKEHARLVRFNGRFLLVDLGSTNMTSIHTREGPVIEFRNRMNEVRPGEEFRIAKNYSFIIVERRDLSEHVEVEFDQAKTSTNPKGPYLNIPRRGGASDTDKIN